MHVESYHVGVGAVACSPSDVMVIVPLIRPENLGTYSTCTRMKKDEYADIETTRLF